MSAWEGSVWQEAMERAQEAAEVARKRREDAGAMEKPPVRHISSALKPLPPPSPEEIAARAAAEAERVERARAWEAEAEARLLASRHAAAEACLPPAFRWCHLDTPSLAASRAAVSLAARLTREERAVFLGPSGSGKTSLAAAAARQVALTGASVRFESAMALAIARSRHPLGEGEPEDITRALKCDLLVIDELGTDELTHGSAVKEVIYERHWSALATWVTTWMQPAQVGAKYGDGIARRVFERAVIIDCGGGK